MGPPAVFTGNLRAGRPISNVLLVRETEPRKRAGPRGQGRAEPGGHPPSTRHLDSVVSRPDQVGVWAVPVVFDCANLTR